MNVPPESERIGQLDVLRALACMCVLVAHCNSVHELPRLPDELGPVGVAIFFALSGYLITSSLARYPHDQPVQVDFAGFYLKRATRILPPYMLLLAVLAPLWWDIKLAWCATFSFNFLYVSGARDYFHVQQLTGGMPPIGHLWSLCVEEHYYWLWPIALACLGRKLAIGLLVTIVLTTPLMAIWLIEALDSRGANPEVVSGVLSRITLTQLTSIAIGSIVALMDKRWLRPMRCLGSAAAPLQVAGLMLLVCAWWLDQAAMRELVIGLCNNDAQYAQAIEPTRIHLWGAGIALIGIPWTSLARFRSWQYVGRISYGLYLYHLPIFAWFGLASSGKSQSILTAAAAILATFAVAMASFHFLEQPCIRWGRQQAMAMGDQRPRFRSLGWIAGVGLLVAFAGTLLACCQSPPLAYLCNLAPKIPLEQRQYQIAPVGTAITAYRWLGVDHHVDPLGFRRTTKIPPRTEGVLRVITVGDSFTWGACVRDTETYSAVFERELQRSGLRVEVINCGKPAGQAEDVLMTIQELLLGYQPDVIIYAATVTDFLPANQAWENHKIDEWMLPENETRFQNAVKRMYAVCRERNIGFTSFVFFQNPASSHESQIALHMEELLRQSQVPFVSIADYIRENSHQDFRVYVPFDIHPNPHCHRLMARLLVRAAEAGQVPGIRLP